jgi:hypothetical protein
MNKPFAQTLFALFSFLQICALSHPVLAKKPRANANEIDTQCKFHQRFYVQIFCTNVVSAAFSSYNLALVKNSYKKCAQKMLMKLLAGRSKNSFCK